MSELRDIGTLRLHPDAAKVPMASRDDLARLRTSLAENGQQDPVDVTNEGIILDGRTRWTLLQELGAQTIQVRVLDYPPARQTAYIIDRALARRHLTMEQKRALNYLLRAAVIEERPSRSSGPSRGQTLRIGHSQGQRAELLGVDEATVKRWDAPFALVGANAPTSEGPTHAIDRRGRPQPLHKEQPKDRKQRSPSRPIREPLRKARPIPAWSRQFSSWCRNTARPDDRDFLRRLDREIHAALKANGIECEGEKK